MRKEDFEYQIRLLDMLYVNRGLGPPFVHAKKHGEYYQFVDVKRLVPPFTQGLREPKSFRHSHISIAINGLRSPSLKEYLAIGNEVNKANVVEMLRDIDNDEMPVYGSKTYRFELDHRLLTHKKHAVLSEIIMQTDYASLYHVSRTQPDTLGLYEYGVELCTPKKGDDIRRLVEYCRSHDIVIPRGREFTAFKKKLEKKVYELIAWPSRDAGSKHRYAGRFMLLQPTGCVVHVISSSGVISTLQPRGITHKMIQPLSLVGNVKSEYKYMKKFVIFGMTYERNDNWSPDSTWVRHSGQFVYHPKNPDMPPLPVVHSSL